MLRRLTGSRFFIGDVNMRDGIQNVKKIISKNTKINIFDKMGLLGYNYIEVGSIVSKTRVPQMADSEEIYKTIHKNTNTKYGLLSIGDKNIDYTITKIKPDIVALVTSVSEDFCKKNMGVTLRESIKQTNESLEHSIKNGLETRVYISCCSTCPISGNLMIDRLEDFVQMLHLDKISHLMISDTTAKLTPVMFEQICSYIKPYVKSSQIGLHLHENKYSKQIVYDGLKRDIVMVDTTFAELGGCIVMDMPHNNLNIRKLYTKN